MSRRLALVITLFALLLAACGGGDSTDSTTPAAETATISIESFQFAGAETVTAGTTVEVTNLDGATHTWTSDDDVWDSGNLGTGDSFEFTFDEPGEYGYFCKIHPFQMTGTIIVEG